MPVFWFALSFVPVINWPRAAFIFLLVHVLLYPASNGYNSYMDRDTESVGGLANPMQPTRQLFNVTVVMDIAGVLLSFLISGVFAALYIFYIICSRLYSYRNIRLKKFAVIGYLTVIINQGGIIFFMVFYGASANFATNVPWPGLVAACFLIGGFYPITQVYQHKADAADGVKTISLLLGKRGTFIFCACMYAIAFSLLFFYYNSTRQMGLFFVLQVFFVPVIIYFLRWLVMVWKDGSTADFKHTMRMNWLASTCTNLAFITILILKLWQI